MHKHLLLFAVLFTAGCAFPVQLDNTGSTCAFSEDPDLNAQPERIFVADEPAFMRVSLADCISACASDVKATCSVRRDGSQLTVTAHGSYVPPGGGACIAVCAGVVATCKTEPLPADTYTIVYGGQTSDLAIPSTPTPDTNTCVTAE